MIPSDLLLVLDRCARAQRWSFGQLVSAYGTQRPKLTDSVHEEGGLEPQHNGLVRCSAWLGTITVSFFSIPSNPGKVKSPRRADGGNPCQNRRSRFSKQDNGKNGIDDTSGKEAVPRNPALFFTAVSVRDVIKHRPAGFRNCTDIVSILPLEL